MIEEKVDTEGIGLDHKEDNQVDNMTENKEGLLAHNLIPNLMQTALAVQGQNLIKSLIQIDKLIQSLVL
jgi:hypothetical protein